MFKMVNIKEADMAELAERWLLATDAYSSNLSTVEIKCTLFSFAFAPRTCGPFTKKII
jgi:hypothetical protein